MAKQKKYKINKIEEIIKSIVISKKEGAKGNALNELLKMRYGKDWRKYSVSF